MGSHEQPQTDPPLARADYENPQLHATDTRYHPEVVATRLAFKRSVIRSSMAAFREHQARAAKIAAEKRRLVQMQKRSVCLAYSTECGNEDATSIDPEYSVAAMAGRLAAVLGVVQQSKLD